VTEYHGGPKCLTRVALRLRMGGANVLVNFLALSGLAYQQFQGGGVPWWAGAAYAVFLVFLVVRARRLKRRVADLLAVAARHAGLERVKDRDRA
jgi:hypothetical protein